MDLATVRRAAGLLCRHPELALWFFRNRGRAVTLPFERRRADGFSRLPRGVTLKPTLSCNLRCKMCSFVANGSVHGNPRDSLPIEAWKRIVDDIARFRPYVTVTGGEPLLYPHTVELIAHIKRRRLFCTMTTNGTLLAGAAEALMEAPPDVLAVSIDGPGEVHDEVRGRPRAYQRATDGLRAVAALKRERRGRYPLLVVNCALTVFNYEHAHELVEVVQELGVDGLSFQHQWSLTDRMVDEHNRLHGQVHPLSLDALGRLDLQPTDPEAMVAAVRRIRKRARAVKGPLLVGFHPELTDEEARLWYSDAHAWLHRRPAVCAWLNTDIGPTGEVEPCLGLPCGNVRDAPFGRVWNNAAFRGHRQRLAANGDLPICVRCCAFFRRD